jgi:uncharacterized membrane protein YfcA
MMDPVLMSLGFAVGVLVSVTGIGGGSLLTPLLILAAGIRPVVAVDTAVADAAVAQAMGTRPSTPEARGG